MENVNEEICPKSWLAQSILVTIFCFLPFGIVGIVYASRVKRLFKQGQYVEANDASRHARLWTLIGFWLWLSILLLYFAFWVGLGIAIIKL